LRWAILRPRRQHRAKLRTLTTTSWVFSCPPHAHDNQDKSCVPCTQQRPKCHARTHMHALSPPVCCTTYWEKAATLRITVCLHRHHRDVSARCKDARLPPPRLPCQRSRLEQPCAQTSPDARRANRCPGRQVVEPSSCRRASAGERAHESQCQQWRGSPY
jgi:hypothetical protein